jgi:RNA polymerase sigma factor (sigma-70 family)
VGIVNKLSDQEILSAILNGEDNRVIPLLYKDILPNVSRLICSNNGSKDEAKDIFQDALMIFYKQVVEGSFNASKYKIHGFIYTISRNLWINYYKKKNRIIRIEPDQEMDIIQEDNILQTLMDNERTEEIKKVFSHIGDKCLEILTYTFFQKLNMKEIAEKMNLSNENAAKTAHYRCKHKLINLIEGNTYFEQLIRNND